MENEISSQCRLLPSSRKLYLRGWITARWDTANKTSWGERCVMKWQGSTNISDVIACKNYSQEAASSMLNKQKFFRWELQFVSESISQALKPGECTVWELAASFLCKGWLCLNRLRLAGFFSHSWVSNLASVLRVREVAWGTDYCSQVLCTRH